ncbi:MAG: MATE family efflux transporter [Clostridiales bacterium]|nr:MATE family efflux transporter [Clostridiales bacterium]
MGPDALNALSLAFPFQMLMMAFSLGTSIGMNALISRYLGQKEQERADRAAGTGIALSLICACFFCVIGLVFAEPFFRFQTDNEAIIGYGKQYIMICGGLCFGQFAQMCVEKLLQSTGRTKLSMVAQLCGAGCNIIMDPILIFGYLGFPTMGVAGAAIATVAGQILAAVVGFILHIRRNPELNFKLKYVRPDKRLTIEIYKIGFPSLIMQCVGSVMNFLLNKILLGFTEAATAVFGAYFKIQSFVFMPIFGMNSAMVPIVSYNYGACKPGRVKETTKLCILIATGIMLLGVALFEFLPDVLLSLFKPAEGAVGENGVTFGQMLEVGRVAFRIIAIHFPFAGFCIVAGSVCQAMGKPQYSLITSLCRQLVVLLPAAWLLSLTGNLSAVWWAFPMAEVACAVLNVFYLRNTLKQSGAMMDPSAAGDAGDD